MELPLMTFSMGIYPASKLKIAVSSMVEIVNQQPNPVNMWSVLEIRVGGIYLVLGNGDKSYGMFKLNSVNSGILINFLLHCGTNLKLGLKLKEFDEFLKSNVVDDDQITICHFQDDHIDKLFFYILSKHCPHYFPIEVLDKDFNTCQQFLEHVRHIVYTRIKTSRLMENFLDILSEETVKIKFTEDEVNFSSGENKSVTYSAMENECEINMRSPFTELVFYAPKVPWLNRESISKACLLSSKARLDVMGYQPKPLKDHIIVLNFYIYPTDCPGTCIYRSSSTSSQPSAPLGALMFVYDLR